MILLTVGLACIPQVGEADFITDLTVNVVQLKNGSYQYKYTLANTNVSMLVVSGFQVVIDPGKPAMNVTGPTRWFFSDGNISTPSTLNPNSNIVVLGWSSLSPEDDIKPGCKAEFTVTSPLPPTPQDYVIDGTDLLSAFDQTTFHTQANRAQIAAPGLAPGLAPPMQSTVASPQIRFKTIHQGIVSAP